MSETERNKGTLTPVDPEIVKRKAIERYGDVFDDVESQISELMCDSDFMKINKITDLKEKLHGMNLDENIEENKIVDDAFLTDLKMADVPDSDDECYF